jgi:tryptophan halogenase
MNIVIVGGGSAGWMTAAILAKLYPNFNIRLIEDPDTPPIGVGESTYEGIRHYCSILEIDEKSFFSYTDASIKIGLQFSGLYDIGDEHKDFIYPFGGANLDGTLWGMQDWLIKKHLYPETPSSEFTESYFPQALLAKHNRFSKNENQELGSFRPVFDTALHFDAIKFGGWLRDSYCIPRGVVLLKNKVVDILVSDEGVDNLVLDDGSIINANLYIDCTGFKSLLLAGALNEPFKSFNDVLPNNRAWATQLPYLDKRKELDSVTKCTFIDNGWCWNIPLWSRLGTGYVYSDKFVEPEKALEEFKKHLMSNKMASPRTLKDLDSASFVDIKMRVGIHERTWVKNVVAIGLSAAFIEPLESNGLFTVHNFLYHLVRALERGKVSQWTKDVYNKSTYLEYFGFVEFIRMHYALSVRTDTPYWKSNFDRSYEFDSYKPMEKDLSHLHNLITSKIQKYTTFPVGGISIISSGLNYPTIDRIPFLIGEINNRMNYKTDLNENFLYLDSRRISWENEALKSPTLYDFLEKEYYSN